MKIDYAIVSSDNNPTYLDFWKPVSKLWKLKFNITPVLLYIGDDNIPIDTTYGIVERYKPIYNIPLCTQCQTIRLWYPSTHPDKVSIISDIDMLPLSPFYFQRQLLPVASDAYTHINPCVQSYGRYPMCYNVARGYVFKKILELPDVWREFILEAYHTEYKKVEGETIQQDWFLDELYLTGKLEKHREEIVCIDREGGQNGRRIDRYQVKGQPVRWMYNPDMVLQDWYYDSHSVRPYMQYKEEIDKLVNLAIYKKWHSE